MFVNVVSVLPSNRSQGNIDNTKYHLAIYSGKELQKWMTSKLL